MTMWRPSEPAEEDVSDRPGIDPQSKRRRSRRRAWRDGLADQTVVTIFEHLRPYRAFERSLIGSVDPRSVIELELICTPLSNTRPILQQPFSLEKIWPRLRKCIKP